MNPLEIADALRVRPDAEDRRNDPAQARHVRRQERGLILGQSDVMQSQIRAAFDEVAQEYDTGTGLEVPVSVRLASGRKPPT